MKKPKPPRKPLDVAGEEVRVGDLVAAVEPRYSALKVMRVVRINPQGFALASDISIAHCIIATGS